MPLLIPISQDPRLANSFKSCYINAPCGGPDWYLQQKKKLRKGINEPLWWLFAGGLFVIYTGPLWPQYRMFTKHCLATCLLMLYCLWKINPFFIFQWRKCADFLYFASRQYDWVAQTCKKNICAKSTDRPKIRDVLGRLLQCHRVYVQWVYNMLPIDSARWH